MDTGGAVCALLPSASSVWVGQVKNSLAQFVTVRRIGWVVGHLELKKMLLLSPLLL